MTYTHAFSATEQNAETAIQVIVDKINNFSKHYQKKIRLTNVSHSAIATPVGGVTITSIVLIEEI